MTAALVSRCLSSLAAGVLSGFGVALSGMTRPAKAPAFLDISGGWDPSLPLVMAGAVAASFAGFRLLLGRAAPLFEERFRLPAAKDIDPPLVIGAVLFGVGWGIAGYWPGPAIASLAAPNWETVVFVPALAVGIGLRRLQAAGPATPAPR